MRSRPKRLVLFELNELPAFVLDDFVERHPESAFAELLRAGVRFATSSEDEGRLSPWITWPTVHRGVTNARHGISHLGQSLAAVDERHPPIWQVLARAGRSVGVGGSLHADPAVYDPRDYAFFLPDPFANSRRCQPPALETFQHFNQQMVEASGRNVERGVPLAPALRLIAKWRALGLSGGLAARLVRQLVLERVRPPCAVRRRSYQALMSFEVVLHQIESGRPDFATCFTNHVASAMHRYWAAAWPEQFDDLALSPEWIDRYAGEIDFAMGCADAMVKRLLRLVESDPETGLIIVSSMGQAAYHHSSPVECELQVVDGERLLAALGIEPAGFERLRAMAPQFHIRVAPQRANALAARLATLFVAGYRVEWERPEECLFNIIFAQRNLDLAKVRIELAGRECSADELGLANVAIQDAVGSTGYHTPEGLLLLANVPADCVPFGGGPVPTQQIAPFVLDLLDVERPPRGLAAGA